MRIDREISDRTARGENLTWALESFLKAMRDQSRKGDLFYIHPLHDVFLLRVLVSRSQIPPLVLHPLVAKNIRSWSLLLKSTCGGHSQIYLFLWAFEHQAVKNRLTWYTKHWVRGNAPPSTSPKTQQEPRQFSFSEHCVVEGGGVLGPWAVLKSGFGVNWLTVIYGFTNAVSRVQQTYLQAQRSDGGSVAFDLITEACL